MLQVLAAVREAEALLRANHIFKSSLGSNTKWIASEAEFMVSVAVCNLPFHCGSVMLFVDHTIAPMAYTCADMFKMIGYHSCVRVVLAVTTARIAHAVSWMILAATNMLCS
jgi:hypothetical protein